MTASLAEGINDEQLIARTLAGDEAAFESLVVRHRSRVFQIAGRYARHEHELADLAQEIFVKAYVALETFRGDAPFEHWLSRIAVRACYDHLRHRQRHPEATLSEITDDQSAWLERAASADAAEKQEALAAADEARELLNLALARLKPADRLVITLLELEERSVREIADLTGWSPTLVKVRAFRARKALRGILEELRHE